MVELPTGTVTFLFTDIEGSTRLLQELGPHYEAVQDAHAEILRRAIAQGGGREIRTEGDSFFAVFPSATGAVRAAVTAQRELAGTSWPHGRPLRVRMGMHTGEGRLGGDDYIGIDVNRAARIAASAHGGQVLLSAATRAVVEHALPDAVTVRDLGEHRLKDIGHTERLFDLVIDGLPHEFPPLRTLDARPNNLPTMLTSFVGREREVQDVAALLATARLVTLTGPGGTGKTRLAIQVASSVVHRFTGGVFFVDLAPLADPGLVPTAIERALGLTDTGARAPLDVIVDELREREVLLVLDNFEHLVDGVDVVDSILTKTSDTRILATSRVVLRLYGEHDYAVPPMAMPDPSRADGRDALAHTDAVALFAERARAVKQGFEITAENAKTVAEICVRVDGLPLAIELAASRARVLSPQAILDRLQQRLPLLASGARNVPGRQRTLRDTIEWSYELLDEPERHLLARLSVFAGGWTVDAADAVASRAGELGIDTLAGLSSLVDNSLIRQSEEAGDPRFVMLETIREYAGERLADEGTADETARRHAEYFAKFAEDAEPHLLASDQARWLDACEREHDNIRAALRWALDTGEIDVGLRIAASLWRFWHQRGHLREGRRWLGELLTTPPAREATATVARAHGAAGGLAYWALDHDATDYHYTRAAEIFRTLDDPRGLGRALYDLSFVAMRNRDTEMQRRLLEESLALAKDAGDAPGILESTGGLAYLKLVERRYVDAIPLFQELVALARKTGNAFLVHDGMVVLGQAYRLLGDHERAIEHYREGVAMLRDAGNITMSPYVLCGIAVSEAELGHHERGVRLWAAARNLGEFYETMAPVESMLLEDPTEQARRVLGDEATDRAAAEGRAMSVEDAVAYALDESRG